MTNERLGNPIPSPGEEREGAQGVAIIGMSGRFPLAGSVDEFWHNLAAGIDAIRPPNPEDRAAARLSPEILQHPDYVGSGYFIDDVKLFDAEFFGFSAAEARITDPQHRIFMECVWEALESAGYISKTSELRIGLYAGASISQYLMYNLYSSLECTRRPTHFLQRLIGNDKDYLATHVSYKLNLRGPSIGVQTACSTSLVSLWLACQGLADHQCDLALAGGVAVRHPTHKSLGYIYEQGNILSADGHCRPFDASAGGTTFGSGAGVVLLKRLDEAIADRDDILAVVKESAVNNDGALKIGYTAPSLDGQAEVVGLALATANIHPETIDYLETHGTGTPLGDPVEIAALTQVFRSKTAKKNFCAIGSVKSNVGHLESAAGVAGLIKTVLALQHKQIPPSLHFHSPNPEIDFADSPFYVNTELTQWPSNGGRPRRAGVSSFGIGGTNAHVILEEAPQRATQPGGFRRPFHILTLSAKDENALRDLARRYIAFLGPDRDLLSVCYTSNTGRRHFQHRLAAVSASAEQMRDGLTAFVDEKESVCLARGQARADSRVRVAFLFTGQGSQYAGMGRQLYETEPVFRNALQRCAEILRPLLDRPLLEVLYPGDAADGRVHETAYTQPALFAVEYALAQLWEGWGIRPAALLGHSVGEYVAACLAGVFSVEDGLKLIATRGRLMQALPAQGEMVAVFADEERVRAALAGVEGEVAVAAVNGPQHTVTSGRREVLAAALAPLAAAGVKLQRLNVSHAFHSPLMEPILADFRRVAGEISYRQPLIPIVSNLSGRISDSSMASKEYWTDHILQPVLFASGMKALSREGCSAFLEIGPNPVLLGMGRQCLADNQGWWLPSLRQGQPDWRQMLLALARLYVEGSSVTWKQFDQHCAPQRITQPTYPFQRKVFWVEEPETEQTPASSRNGSGTGPRAHPLLGYQIRLAGARELRFESRIGPSHPAFLDHHRIFSKAVVPLTAYLEMALAAGKVALGTQHLVLKDVVIHKALILSEAGEVILQTVLTPDVAGGYGFEIYSLDSAEPASDPGWTKHVMGCVSSGHASESPATADLAELQVEVAAAVEVEEYYRQFAERALRYGPDFQAIRRLHHAPGRSLAEISLSQKLLPEADGYLLHPVLMDACQQAAAAVLPSTAAGDTYLPVGIARLELFRATGNHFWSHARLSSGDRRAEKLLPETTIEMFDASGVGIARLEGLSVRRASADALMAGSASDFESWLYQVVWRVQPRRPRSINASPDAQPGTWLIFTDSKGLGSELAARLREVHHRVVLVEAGKTFEQVSRDCYRVDPEDAAHFHELFGKRLGASGDLRGVVHLWSLLDDDLGNPRPDLETVQRVQTLGCRSALNAVHSIDEFGGAPPALWLVTRAARAVGGKAPLNVAQAPLWGLGRAISVERPELQCRCLDLDPARPADEAGELAEEVLNASPEDQIAWRSGERKVARLARWEEGAATRRAISDAEAFRLAISDSGILEEVRLRPTSRRHPGTGQVEIEVRASGLNFRDVLQALGVLRGKAAQTTVGAAAEMLMGSECAGTVVEVGDGVSDSKVGDEVVALAQGSMASRVTVARELTFPKPERLSFEEAAALPVVFLTAYFGLHHLAKIRPGDRVLVHAAAGGVGQAAIQLAHNAGAEVLATASPAKWDFLRAVGVQHVMNSRSLDFSDQVLAITDGKGVDIVLNSLSGEFIRKSFDALRRGGRFLEIGKIGIWEQERVSQVRPDVSYYAYDIAAEMTKDPQAIRSMMSEIISGFREGRLNPPPLRVFPVTEAAGAFRLMAEGKHIGKIVLSVHGGAAVASIPAHAPIRSDASYLITGGLGMLGLKVAGWMARRGAGRLVLCGRSQPSAAAHQAIEEIISEGTQVKVVVADVTSPRSVESLVSAADLGDLPLRGIVHAAGVLHDGVLSEQSWENMREVMGPKIDGAWNLHLASQNCPLGFFVCFSSTASTLGSAAQANYAAGNAFLDALAHHRKALGLPGLTINWGPWGEVGMAARLGEQAATRRAVRGIADIPPDTGLRILEYSLALPGAVQIGVSPINWQKFLDPGARVIPFFEILAGIGGPARESNLLKQLKESLPAKRRSLLVAYVRAQLAKAVGLESGDTITPEQRFLDLGIDSLIAIELRNRLQEDLGSPLAQTVIFDYPTLGGLVSYLETLVVGGEPVEPESKRKPADSVRAVDRSELDDFLKDIGDLTETEIKNRLTQRRQPLSARR